MNITVLQTFLTILDAGSLIRASAQLNVTQSTVTARLQSLERELGQTLIKRDKSGVSPTAAGLRLRRYAETMTGRWQQARQETALSKSMNDICNIGCHVDLWSHLGRQFFSHVRVHAPDVAISVWKGSVAEASHWLDDGRTDVLLNYAPGYKAGQVATPLPPDRIVLVSTDPEAPMRFDPGYVYVEAGEEFGRWHAAEYADADIARISFGSSDLGLAHLLAVGGSAYLPDRVAAPLVRKGRLHNIKEAPEFERPVYLSVNSDAAENWPWLNDAIAALG